MCDQCGKCCGLVLFDKNWFTKHRFEITTPVNELIEVKSQGKHRIIAIPESLRDGEMKCVFLTEDNRCAVHDDKPELCRNYDCNGDQEGQLWCGSIQTGSVDTVGYTVSVMVQQWDSPESHENALSRWPNLL